MPRVLYGVAAYTVEGKTKMTGHIDVCIPCKSDDYKHNVSIYPPTVFVSATPTLPPLVIAD